MLEVSDLPGFWYLLKNPRDCGWVHSQRVVYQVEHHFNHLDRELNHMSEVTIRRRLSNHERGFHDLETPERRQIVSGVAFLSDNISSELLWKRMEKFVRANPLFRSRVVGNNTPEWRMDRSFDLMNHCDETSIHFAGTEQILSHVSNAASHGLSDDQPPWRISLIRFVNGSQETERCALAIWAHHSLLDGLQGMSLLDSLLDGTQRPLGERNPASDDDTKSDEAAPKDPVVSSSCIRSVTAEMLRRPLTGPLASNGFASAKRTTLAFEWSRQSFQAARKSITASFQEVLLAVLTDGLARYTQARRLERNVRVILPLGRSNNHPSASVTNRHDVGYIELPTTSCDTSRQSDIRKNLQQRQRDQEQGIFASILSFMNWLPRTIRRAVVRRYAQGADLLISLIPGTRAISTLAGAKVTALYAQPALPPRHSVAMGITVNRQNVCLAVQFDPSCIEQPLELKDCLETAYQKIVLGGAGRNEGKN